MIDLIADYEKALRDIVEKRKTADSTDDALYSGMESDLRYALEWMKSGKQPGKTRGIERRACYDREKLVDPLLMQRYFRSNDSSTYGWDDHYQEDSLGRYDKERLEVAMGCLTDKQREIYMMIKGNAFTYQKTADMLGVSRGTVREAIIGADKRISRALKEYEKIS